MGSRVDTGGGSGGNTGPDAGFFISEQKKKEKKQAQINEKDDTQAKMDLFYEQGATNIKNTAKTPALALLSGPLQAGSRKNREFFTDKVLGSKNYKGTTKDDFMNLSATQQEDMYQDYMKGRQTGNTDAYGNKIRNDSTLATRSRKSAEQPKTATQMDNTGVKSDMIIADKTAPTSAEMTDDEYSLDTKKRGRKKTIMTSVTGVDTPATLSKKTLLGG